MSGTVTPFQPTANAPFQFQATLLEPTAIVDQAVQGPTYNCTVLWNTAGQRWYLYLADQNGMLVLNKPLIASLLNYSINLVAGYFAGSTLVYLENSASFVVTP